MRLKKLELDGYKSFARKQVLEFNSPITAIVGPNGSGKCVVGSTKIPLKSGKMVTIKELFDQAHRGAQQIEYYNDGMAVLPSKTQPKVVSLNLKTQKLEWLPVQAFVRRRAPTEMLEITTKSGKTITATPYHPLFTLNNGEIQALRADELRPGVSIATPRYLPAQTNKQSITLTNLLSVFQHSDRTYLPFDETLLSVLQKQVGSSGYGAKTAYARACGLQGEVVQRVYQGQALNISYAKQLFQHTKEKDYFAHRTPKSAREQKRGAIRVPEYIDEKLARFLGYIISEGRVTKSNQVWFVNSDPEVIKQYINCAEQSFGIKARSFSYKKSATDVLIFSKTLCRLLERIFKVPTKNASRHKKIPPQIYASPDYIIAAFLSALLEGDGYLKHSLTSKQQCYIEYATASRELAGGVETLLLRLGVNPLVRKKRKYASNTTNKTKRYYWSVFIYGKRNLQKLANQLDIKGRKGSKLEEFRHLTGRDNPNLDLLPNTLELVNDLIKISNIKIKPLRIKYPTLAAYRDRRCQPSRYGIKRVLEAVKKHGQLSQEAVKKSHQLKQLAESDVYWDEIVSVKKKKGEGYVYDLTVGQQHNFVANNIIVHNSNVVEGFRFVLGEQSMKAMRGGKSRDMIFNGSTVISRSNRAAARLTLDNSDGIFNVDFKEVVIERVVHRDGENEYYLNGGKVRLKDIWELLSAAHIGVSNHHIISQGQADRILNAKPVERKEMIEDALGLKVYHHKKRDAERKLYKTEENLREVDILRRELAPRLRYLKSQAEKAQRAQELKDALKRLYIDYFKREYVYLTHLKRQIDTGRRDPQEKLEQIENRITQLKQELASRAEQNDEEREIIAYQSRLKEAREEKDRAARELANMEGRWSALDQIKRKDQTNEDRAIPFDQLWPVAGEVEELLNKAEEEVDHRPEAARHYIMAVRDKLRSFLDSFRGRDYQEQQLNETEKEKIRLQELITEQQKRVEELKEKERELNREYEQFRENREQDEKQDREKEREWYQLIAKQKDLSAELERFRTLEDRYRRELSRFHQELQEAGVLIGSVVLGYKDASVYGENGEVLSEQEISQEPREEQEKRHSEIERSKIRLEELGVGGSYEEVMKEYREISERDEFLAREMEDLRNSVDSLRQMIAELESTLEQEFRSGLKKIDGQFKKFFTSMFGGGSAAVHRVKVKPATRKRSVEQESEDDEEEESHPQEGVEISVSLPRKKIRGLMMLSGGERALTSIALTFAITQVNPPPFLILDETDAALDEANSERYGGMIRDLSRHSQLILITHNRETMARADRLYGVTMGQSGASQLLSIEFEEAEGVAN